MPVNVLEDPLYQAQHRAGLDILGLYDPEAEEARYNKALGLAEQQRSQRYARAGLTGSSDDLSAASNLAKDFNLNWDKQKQEQLGEAIKIGQLPIGNLLSQGTQDITRSLGQQKIDVEREAVQAYKDTNDARLLGGVLSSLGLPQWLAQQLFGINPNPLAGLLGGGGGGGAGSLVPGGVVPWGLNKFWDWITGGSDTPVEDLLTIPGGGTGTSLDSLSSDALLAAGVYPGVEENLFYGYEPTTTTGGGGSNPPIAGSGYATQDVAGTVAGAGGTGAGIYNALAGTSENVGWTAAQQAIDQAAANAAALAELEALTTSGNVVPGNLLAENPFPDVVSDAGSTLISSTPTEVVTEALVQSGVPQVDAAAIVNNPANATAVQEVVQTAGPSAWSIQGVLPYIGPLLSLASIGYNISQGQDAGASIVPAVTAAGGIGAAMGIPALVGFSNPITALPSVGLTAAMLLDEKTRPNKDPMLTQLTNEALSAPENVRKALTNFLNLSADQVEFIRQPTGEFTPVLYGSSLLLPELEYGDFRDGRILMGLQQMGYGSIIERKMTELTQQINQREQGTLNTRRQAYESYLYPDEYGNLSLDFGSMVNDPTAMAYYNTISGTG